MKINIKESFYSMEAIKIESKSCITRMKEGYFAMRYLPFRLTTNVYRGCTHGCVYCSAVSTHIYMKEKADSFYKKIFVKKNLPEVFEKEMIKHTRLNKPKTILVIGNVADAYQPVERKNRITRKILELCLKYKFPCFVETKSSLILDDIDILEKLAAENLIGVGMTVTSYDEKFNKMVEPFVARHKSVANDVNQKGRLLTLKKLAEIGVDTYLHLTPYFPYITDETVEEIIADAGKAKVNSVIMAPLELSTYHWKTLKEVFASNPGYEKYIPEYERLYFQEGRKLGTRITTSESEHLELEKKISGLCQKQGVQYWAFTNPQYNTANISGVYKKRYPIMIDYWELLREKKQLTFPEAEKLYNNFPVDNGYKKSFKEFWNSGQLFEGVFGVEQQVSKQGEIVYVFKNN